MNDELTTIVADELDIFLRERGMFINRTDLEDLADQLIGVVDSYEDWDDPEDIWDDDPEVVV